MSDFKINCLDHVAIRTRDMKASIAWYEKVLGLKKYEFEKWGGYPIFMLAGKVGVAIFPANEEDAFLDPNSRNVKIDHFAFNVNPEDFEKAQEKYKQLGLNYDFQDHHYFHSIYTKDPDGHTVELTTLVLPEEEVY